jgi:hypothetical protein
MQNLGRGRLVSRYRPATSTYLALLLLPKITVLGTKPYPAGDYMTIVEHRRLLPDGQIQCGGCRRRIEFTRKAGSG